MSDVIGVSARQLSGVIEADLATPALPLGAPHEVDDHDHEKNHDEGSNEGHRSIVSKHAAPEDTARRFNRTENVRPIPPTDPDVARLYPRRNDSESINRNLEDTLWLGRAHSVGHTRQHLNLLGCALMFNGLALHRHQRYRTRLAA